MAEAGKTLTFTVTGDPTAISKNKRLHYMKRHALVQRWKASAWLAWAEAGRVRFEGKVRVAFTLRRGVKVDPDNALGCLYGLIDGLKDQPGRPAMIADDSDRHVEYAPVVQESGARWKGRPEVVVRVEAMS